MFLNLYSQSPQGASCEECSYALDAAWNRCRVAAWSGLPPAGYCLAVASGMNPLVRLPERGTQCKQYTMGREPSSH